jgi:mono/diheme cytochrome c family protein
MMGGGGMMAGGCATCHGADGHGRTTPTFTSPNVTYGNLTDPQGMLMPDGTRGPTYSDAGIMKAVTQGLDPEGSHLAAPMPRWQLTISEWTDLLAYLKTLK